MKAVRLLSALSALLLLAGPASLSAADPESEPPSLRVENVRRVYHNGEHNAFTDLIRWRDAFWLAFRSCPDGHGVSSNASVRILRSPDGGDWEEVHRFSIERRDPRDPHFLAFGDRLFVYTGAWWAGDGPLPREDYNMNQHLGYAVHTGDGESWSDPVPLEGTYGHYIWRAAAHGGKAYLVGRRMKDYAEEGDRAGGGETVEAALLESEDGLVWRYHSLIQEKLGNETALLFEPNGTLLALSRTRNDKSVLARATPPWREKARVDLPGFLGGPLLARWGDQLLVGGRRQKKEGPRTVLHWLVNDELVPCAELPSGGDNSYPGFAAIDDRRGLVSWYSSHEKGDDGEAITAIYVAEVEKGGD